MKVSRAPQHIHLHDRIRQTDGSQRAPGARERLEADRQKGEKREQSESNGKQTGDEGWLDL